MFRFLISLIGFGLILGLGMMTMIYGWGLEPASWGWIIGGGIGSALLAGIFRITY